jgi:hypothetical protein
VVEASLSARVFLFDLRAPSGRQIPRDQQDTGPQWSPVRDQLAYWRDGEGTVLEDVRTGVVGALAMSWPARFDPSGAYLFTLDDAGETVIADAATATVIARLPGGPGYDPGSGSSFLPPVSIPVIASESGFSAVLGPAPQCPGSVLYVNSASLKCLPAAGTPVFSPDASRIALARKTGDTGRVQTPSLEALNMHIYEIVVIEVATGAERVVARGALGLDAPPRMQWDEAGRHLLVSWPAYYGL